MANNVFLAVMQTFRLALSMQSGVNGFSASEQENMAEKAQQAVAAANATASYYFIDDEEERDYLDDLGLAVSSSEEQAEEEGLTGGGDGDEPKPTSGLDDLFDQMEDSAHDTAGESDEQDWAGMTDAERAEELLLRANALVDNYGDILGSDDITSDSLESFVDDLREAVNNSDNDEFKGDANNFLRNYDAANNFEQNSQDQNTPVQDPAEGDFVGSDGSSPVEAYDEQRIEFWTIVASLGLAVIAAVAVPSAIKAANRGLSLRNNGTRFLLGQSSLKDAKKLSKLSKKVKKAQEKLSKNPESKRLASKLEKAVNKRDSYAKSCYNASKKRKANYSYLKKYSKKALRSASLGNREYTNEEELSAKNYKKLMKAVNLYAKAMDETSSSKKTKLMDKATKIAENVTLADGSLYYGSNVMKLGKNTYPLFPQRYISTGITNNLDEDTQKYFNEIYKLYPTMEKATYSGEISYELNGETKYLKYSFDNAAAADAIKSALLFGISTDVEAITITETVQTPRRSKTETTQYAGQDWKDLQYAMKTTYNTSRALINKVAEEKIFAVEKPSTARRAQVAQTQAAERTQTTAPTQAAEQPKPTQQQEQTQPQEQTQTEEQKPLTQEEINNQLVRFFHNQNEQDF